MALQRIPLSQPIETRDGQLNTDSKCVNGYFETRNQMREFIKRPGLITPTITPALPAGDGQGIYLFKGLLYLVINNVLYKVDPTTYTSTVVGTLTGALATCYFVQTLDSNYLFLHNQTNGYLVNGSTGAFSQIKDDTIVTTTILTGGTGYITPYVTFSSPSGGGTTATGTVQTTGGVVTGITITNGGSGYTSSDTLVVTIGDSGSTTYTWTASTAVGTGATYTTNGNNYLVLAAGTTGVVQPTINNSDVAPAWTTGWNILRGQEFTASGYLYVCTAAGTTGALAPSFTSGSAPDGTATVEFVSLTGTGGVGLDGTAIIQWIGTFTPTGGSGATATALLQGFPAGPLVPGVVFLDSYIVVGTVTGRLYNCDVGDPTHWNALDYVTAESEPDNLVGISKHLNYILAHGQWSTDFFYDYGTFPGSPLAAAPSYKFEVGCANGDSIVSFENTVLFIGISKTTGTGVYGIDGVSPVKLSTVYIDRILNNSNMSEIKAYTLRYNGHPFYVLTLHDLNVTIVYDVSEKMWYQWTMWALGDSDSGIPGIYAEQYFRPSFFSGDGLSYYLLDDDNGTLYVMSDLYYNDAGAPIYYRAVTDIVDNGTTKRKFYNRVEIVGDKQPAIMNIRHTDDDYKSWSPYRTVNLNASRPQIYQTGQGRRRAWEFLCTDNQPLRLDAAEVDFEIGELEGGGVSPTVYRS